MKVHELMDQLKDKDPNAPVATEGCDCYGPASEVTVVTHREKTWVLIGRVPGESGL